MHRWVSGNFAAHCEGVLLPEALEGEVQGGRQGLG